MKLCVFGMISSIAFTFVVGHRLGENFSRADRESTRRQAFEDGRVEARSDRNRTWKLGFNDGWTECCIDYIAITDYGSECKGLESGPDVESDFARKRIWRRCVISAWEQERDWYSLADETRLSLQVSPFWSRGVGEPRMLK